MKTKSNEQEEMICIGVRIPKELHEEFKQLAKNRDLTISQVIRIAIKDFIKKAEAM